MTKQQDMVLRALRAGPALTCELRARGVNDANKVLANLRAQGLVSSALHGGSSLMWSITPEGRAELARPKNQTYSIRGAR